MSSMEVHLAGSSEDRLLSSLHFDGKRSASYVTGRSEVSYPSSSGGSFSPTNGIRVMRFALNDSAGYLNGDTVRLSFVLHNVGAQPLTPVTASPCSLFRRLRITAGGVEIEDLEFLGRYAELRQMLKPSDEKLNDLMEGWGAGDEATLSDQDHADPIPAGAERKILCKLPSSFLMNGKKIMLNAMTGLTLELELSDADTCFAEDNCNYTIIRPTILSSVLSLDGVVSNSFSQHLLSGKSINMNCTNTAFNMKVAVTSSTFSLPLARGFSRLSTVLFSFHNGVGREAITFNHPLAGAAPNGTNDQFSYHLQLGAMKTPVFDVSGCAEQYMRTRMAISMLDRDTKSMSISPFDYRNTRGVFALSLERAQGEDEDIGHTGQSTLSGNQLTLQLRNCPAPVGANPLMLHVTCFFDSIVQLSASGVNVLM
jgi:hypothetical protein